MSGWYVYILRCNDGTLYTGVSKDLKRRLHEHNTDNRLAAAYTRARRPVTLVYCKACKDRSAALIREAEIRRMGRQEKIALIEQKKKFK